MKKVLIAFFSVSLLLIGCNTTPKYKINGKVIDGIDGKKVYMQKLEGGKPGATTDSAVLSKGTFEMKGMVTEPFFYILFVEGEQMGTLVFLENADINVSIDLKDPIQSSVSGTPLNDQYEQYKKGSQGFKSSLKALSDEYNNLSQNESTTKEQLDSIEERYEGITEQQLDYQVKFLKETPSSLVTAYVLSMALPKMSMEDIDAIYSKIRKQIKDTSYTNQIAQEIEKMRPSSVGQKFIDLNLQTPDGKSIALSDIAGKGKYVLVDFWASWCPPCRAENPNIVALYNKYKGNDFDIVGVSFDNDAEKWKKGIADDKITWTQMSDLKKWQSIAVEKYNIKGIPHTILLDKDGVIIAKNLTGKKLAAKLEEIFGKK